MIRRDTLLQTTNPLFITVQDQRIRASNNHGRTIYLEPYSLTIFDIFDQPTPVGLAVDQLSKLISSKVSWIALMEQIQRLINEGFLVNPNDLYRNINQLGGFSSPDIHIDMLNDTQRTHAFLDAIAATVKADDVVLDIGTGTGILAVAAAKAGARKVYAIEATQMAQTARKFIQQNGFSETIEVIQQWSTNISLPERANILVSEIIGNEALDENILQVFGDAQDRLLSPNAIILPQKLNLYLVPIDIPDDLLKKFFFQTRQAKVWEEEYNMLFSSLVDSNPQQMVRYVRPKYTEDFKYIGPPSYLSSISLTDLKHLDIELKTQSIHIQAPARFCGFLLYTEILLTDKHSLNLNPQLVQGKTSWSYKLWLLSTPLVLDKDIEVVIRSHGCTSSRISFSIILPS